VLRDELLPEEQGKDLTLKELGQEAVPELGLSQRWTAYAGISSATGFPRVSIWINTALIRPSRQPDSDELLQDEQAQTQFERAAEELGIKLIHANSPQAKGRIERAFGTLQDRLVKEIRLAGVATCAEANRFLDVYLPTHPWKRGPGVQGLR
jgi:hypothetical protein